MNNIKELVAYAKTTPLNYGSWGNGSGGHMLMEMLMARTGMPANHIPYKTVAQIAPAVMAGEVPVAWIDAASPLGLIKSGKLRAIAVSSGVRLPQLPEVPTLIEQGVPFKQDVWYGLFAPARTPAPLVERMNALLNGWIRLPETKEFFVGKQNWPAPEPMTPAQFTQSLKDEVASWKQLMTDARIAPEN